MPPTDLTDTLCAETIAELLGDSTYTERLLIHDTLPSTNDTAKALARIGVAHGTVVMANHQTAGRGRRSERSFFSPSGGIYLSLILQAERVKLSTLGLLTAFSALTLCQLLEERYAKQPSIKWVNDIFLDNKKISGVLTETVSDPKTQTIDWLVLGIGINFDTPACEFPPELQAVAGSVFPHGKPATANRNQLVAELIWRLLHMIEHADEPLLLAGYRERLLFLGQTIMVHQVNQPSYEARAIDIDNQAGLVVERADGTRTTLSHGEISIRPIA